MAAIKESGVYQYKRPYVPPMRLGEHIRPRKFASGSIGVTPWRAQVYYAPGRILCQTHEELEFASGLHASDVLGA